MPSLRWPVRSLTRKGSAGLTREPHSDGQNGPDQPDDCINIADRLPAGGPLSDLQPQLDSFATDIGKLGLGLGPQVGDLGLGLGPRRSITSALVANSGNLA